MSISAAVVVMSLLVPTIAGLITDLFTGFPICPTTAALRAASAYPAAALLQAAAAQQYTTAAAR